MKPSIPYIEWRNRIESLTPEELRIDDDLIVIQDAQMMDRVKKPVKVDATTAIIYEEGSALISINMRDYAVKAPCMVVILEGSTFFAKETNQVKSKAIVMSHRFLENFFPQIQEERKLQLSTNNAPVFLLNDNLQIYEQYLNMLMALLRHKDSPYRLEAARHLTLAMFYGFSFSTHQDIEETSGGSRLSIYNRFIDLLEVSFRQERSVGFYANQLAITPKYLSEVTKDICGQSAIAIIQDRVIAECKALLYSTDKSIQEISDELNFPTQSEFGKYFKRQTGVSPKFYRENE